MASTIFYQQIWSPEKDFGNGDWRVWDADGQDSNCSVKKYQVKPSDALHSITQNQGWYFTERMHSFNI
jgi:hypothetical protein